jgi:septal ring factor EnvC (AmiA/AmiB activator)
MNRALRFILPVLAAAFLAGHGTARAADAGNNPAEKLDKPIQRYEKNIQKLQSGIEIHLGKLQISSEKEFSLLGDLESIDKNLALQKIRVQVMEERLASQKNLLLVKIRDLNQAQGKLETMTGHLRERLRAFYLMGRTGILNVTFSTRTLPEQMLFNDSFQRMLSYDRELVDHYRDAIDQLVQARDAHEQESALLERYIKEARQEQAALDTIRTEKSQLLRRVKSEKLLYEQALDEMKTAAVDLQQSLTELQKKKAYLLEGFVSKKGKLQPPVTGRVVSRFGSPLGEGKDPQATAAGITIDAADGSEIRAIFAGRVIFAGYKRGYGNMVIVDHGMDYYSVTSRMEKISVAEGDIIDEGSMIGRAGDIATLFDEGLYFEIRHRADPVDPLDWIARENLSGL